jgi:hypothetical protein
VEKVIEKRTSKLAHANQQLQGERAERRRTEEKLRRSETVLAFGQRLSWAGSWSWTAAPAEFMFSRETFRILRPLSLNARPFQQFVRWRSRSWVSPFAPFVPVPPKSPRPSCA